MATLIHGEIGTLDDVMEPLDTEFYRTGIFNIEVEVCEQVDSRFFQFPLFSYILFLEYFNLWSLNFHYTL